MFDNLFEGKNVLVTGHTGFKGSWLTEWLLSLKAEVTGYSLPNDCSNKMFQQLLHKQRLNESIESDIRDYRELSKSVAKNRPDFIFHLAAQPLVRQSYETPRETLATNILGTTNLLEAVRDITHKCVVVIVTTDKCYENREWLYAYRESDPLGGHDPYSASKACAEIVTHSYRKSFFGNGHPVRVASARAGNVIGGGDWAADRIVPDIVRSLREKKTIKVRNRHATRPWQHVLEPLSGYLWLAAKLHQSDDHAIEQLDCFNFGPSTSANQTVCRLVQEVLTHMDGDWKDDTEPNQAHEAGLLNLTIEKAHHLLQWRPCWSFEQAVEKTVSWYQADASCSDMREKTLSQILTYCESARKLSIAWATEECLPKPLNN